MMAPQPFLDNRPMGAAVPDFDLVKLQPAKLRHVIRPWMVCVSLFGAALAFLGWVVR
jgi:hypothetical protein